MFQVFVLRRDGDNEWVGNYESRATAIAKAREESEWESTNTVEVTDYDSGEVVFNIEGFFA